ncbi:MAG: CoA transferase [Chloroflexi bacterium]|nr:CoA transferase [Chloroflexota bacterium]
MVTTKTPPPPARPLALLAGIKIAAFTQFLLGPAAVQYLADMGAEVVKVEPPSGAWERTWAGGDTFLDGVSAFYLLAHRNVRSLRLDLKHPDGRDVARRLVAGADVLVENFRPGVMDRFGLGYDAVKQINPNIVYASASGYGGDSPYRDLPGQDLLIQAMTGLPAITGRAGDPPTPLGTPAVDQHGAALLAMGILGALFHRQRTGAGQRVEVTMVQSALDLQMEPLVYFLNGGHVERPHESLGSAFHPAPYGIYETQDGYLALSLSPVKTIRHALGGPPELEPYEDPKIALVEREEIRRRLDPILRTRTTQEWLDLLRPKGVWCAPVNDYERALTDPAICHLDPILGLDHPQAGHVRLLKHPIRYGAGQPEVRRIPPALGEDTDAVLGELGYSREAVEQLRHNGVI